MSYRRAVASACLACLVLGACGPSRIDRAVPSAAPTSTSAVQWPAEGQGALVVGGGAPQASPGQRPVPIASVAKVMTAYLTLERDPLRGSEGGWSVTVTAADVAAEQRDAASGQSVAAVRAGERLDERQLLEALLIPSGNNIARMLAARVDGSVPRFVADMNAAARGLGMGDTTYTDPSGRDPGTVSTASDQLRVLRRAMLQPVFDQIVSMASVTLPVAGTLRNTNPLIGAGYAGKTGSDTEAGACLAFYTRVMVGGVPATAAGVVLGQWSGDGGTVVLAAAGVAAQALVGSVSGPAGGPGAPGSRSG